MQRIFKGLFRAPEATEALMEREARVGSARGLWEETTSPQPGPGFSSSLHNAGEMGEITVIKTQRRKCPRDKFKPLLLWTLVWREQEVKVQGLTPWQISLCRVLLHAKVLFLLER